MPAAMRCAAGPGEGWGWGWGWGSPPWGQQDFWGAICMPGVGAAPAPALALAGCPGEGTVWWQGEQ